MKETKSLINLTPHAIVLRDVDGMDHVIPSSGITVRITMIPGEGIIVPGVPVAVWSKDASGPVVGLPELKDNTYYIVSALVGMACTDRLDILVPGTGPLDEAIRDETGRIIAVTRLKQV